MAATAPPLKLYSAKICPYAQRATLALAEVGADHEHVEIDLQNKPSWYASKVNPASKVPVLQVGASDETSPKIPESLVLLELVADLFPGTLLPDDAVARAEARYFITRFTDLTSAHFFGLIYKGDVAAGEPLLKGLPEINQLLQRHEGPFFLGEKISIADLGVSPWIGRLFALGKAGLVPGGIYEKIVADPANKPLLDYHALLTSRPSWSKTFDEEYIVSASRARIEAFRKA